MAGVVDPPAEHMFCKGVRAAAKRTLGLLVRNRKEPLPYDTVMAMGPCMLLGGPTAADRCMSC